MTRFGRILLAIVIVGFGVRVAYVALAKEGPCPTIGQESAKYACGDQYFYNAEANTIAAGEGFVEPFNADVPPAADHPPLTVAVLAPVSWLAEDGPLSWIVDDHNHVREHRYTMVALGTLLIFLIALLGRRVAGETVGLVAAGIAAVNPNIWVNDGLVMSETITGVVVVAALLCALRMWDRPSLLRAAVLGGLCGLAALARAELLLFVALLAVVVCLTARATGGDRGAFAVASVVTALVVIAPWVGFNLSRFDNRTFLSTNDGLTLLGSNCDLEYYGSGTGLWSSSGPGECLENPPPPGDQSEVSAHYRDKAFDYMRSHKSRVPFVAAARVGRTWSLYRPLDMVGYNVGEGREKWVTRLGLAFYYPELLAAIFGAVVLWRRPARRELYVLCVPAIAVTIFVAVTYGQTRFRATAEPSLAILAAVGAVEVVRRLRRRADTSTPRTDPVAVSQS